MFQNVRPTTSWWDSAELRVGQTTGVGWGCSNTLSAYTYNCTRLDQARCFTVTGRTMEPGRHRTLTDSDEGSTAAMLDEVGVKPATTPPCNNSASSPSSASLSAEQAATVNVKHELDQSTSTCDKVSHQHQ